MQFTGEHVRTRVKNGNVKVVAMPSAERARHWKHIAYQTSLRNQRQQRQFGVNKMTLDRSRTMELLTNEPKFGEGRGRSSVASGFNTETLLEGTGTDTLADAVEYVISLGSPFLAALNDDDHSDWYGSRTKAIQDLEDQLEAEGIENVAVSQRQIKDKAERKTTIKFTFRRVA